MTTAATLASVINSITGKLNTALVNTGGVLQVVVDRDSGSVATQSSSFVDGAVNATITPLLATSKILVFVKEPATGDVDNDSQSWVEGEYRLMRDAVQVLISNNFQFARGGQMRGADGGFYYLDSPNTTSAVTYKTQYRVTATPSSRSLLVNGSSIATMVLMEIAG